MITPLFVKDAMGLQIPRAEPNTMIKDAIGCGIGWRLVYF